MMPGLGGMNPRQIQGMMKQLGIKSEEINATKVIFELESGTKLVINNPNVTAIDMQGQKTYTVMGTAVEEKGEVGIPQEDIDLVAEQTKKTKEEAETALKETDGDIAEAIAKLK